MTRPSQWVDLDKFPTDERPHILELAQKHNALSQDVDGISGYTLEEKKQFYGVMGWLRKWINFFHGKRFHVLLAFVTFHYGLGTLKQLGLSPEQASRLVEAVIKIAEKFAGV